jgi:membrane-associated protein
MAIGVGVAAWLGEQVGYTIGRHFGRPYLDKRKGKWRKVAVARSERIYSAWGWWAVVVARFVPWARVFVPVIAGVARMNYYKFFSSNLVGAVAWGSGLTIAGFFAATIPVVKNASYGIAIFFILASVIAGIRTWRENRKNTI